MPAIYQHQLAFADMRALIEAQLRIGDETTLLSDRRQQLLVALGELTGADLGIWAWGRGHASSHDITPVAVVEFGFTDLQRTIFFEMGLDDRSHEVFRQPILERFNSESQATVARRDIQTDEEWRGSLYHQYLQRMGMDSWLHAVRYFTPDTWANIFFARITGKPEFGPREVGIVDLAIASISWLHINREEQLPAGAVSGLTDRQRVVMLMLLDGLSRKQIATRLQLTEHTIGDHIKAIYRHFHVHSSTELGAQFLRNG